MQRGAWRLTSKQLAFFKFTVVRDPLDRFVSTFNFLRKTSPSLGPQLDLTLSQENAVAALAEQWASRLLIDGWWEWHLWPQVRPLLLLHTSNDAIMPR